MQDIYLAIEDLIYSRLYYKFPPHAALSATNKAGITRASTFLFSRNSRCFYVFNFRVEVNSC